MKKDRNAFFQNNSSSSYFYPMNTMPVANYGMTPMATESNSSFYQGPIVPMQSMPMGSEYNSELEARLAKLERQINRLDTRVSKLESEIGNSSNGSEYTTNNMYMV